MQISNMLTEKCYLLKFIFGEFIAFVRKHYIPEGLNFSIQRQKNKKNENPVVGSFSEVKKSKKVKILLSAQQLPQFLSKQKETLQVTTFWYADFKYFNRKMLSTKVFFGEFIKKNTFCRFWRFMSQQAKLENPLLKSCFSSCLFY